MIYEKNIIEYIKKIGDSESYILFDIYGSFLEYNKKEIKDTILNFFQNEENKNLINETLWIGQHGWQYLGIYKNKIIAFGEDGYFYPFCRSIQNIPLEILSRNSFSINYSSNINNNIYSFNELVFCAEHDNYIQILNRYLNFTNNNNIPLDAEYFNKNGELKMFYYPFEIDYDYAEFGIEHLKGKEFLIKE